MSTKIIVVLALCIIALVLLIVTGVVLLKAGNSRVVKESAYVKSMLDIVKIIVSALILLIGGATVATTMTGCAAKRSITVQGTIVRPTSSDSTRIIISSQESYTGVKKK